MKKLKILFCAPEVSPYAKTGGLADVTGALPASLQNLGCDVRIFMPLHRCARDKVQDLKLVVEGTPIPVGIHDYHVQLWESRTSTGIPLYLLEKDEFFDRSYLYGTPNRGDYEDNAERFITFCRSVHSLCSQLSWFPEIFHLHDWQTALIATYHFYHWRYDPNFMHTGTVFTIHNLAYHGLFPGNHFNLTHLPQDVFSPDGMEFWGNCNFLKAGLVYSDFLTTVSPTYSKEIQQPRFGHGLEGVLQLRRDRLAGILNGIDTNLWDPRTDALISKQYDIGDLSGKRICKEQLLSQLGFPKENCGKPLLGMVGRLAIQKGFDILLKSIEAMMDLPISLIILGTGEPEIERQLKLVENLHPEKVKIIFQFDEVLAHQIEAGADIFLMPSRYEPCGLNQMYSLRYGTIPVVHATGGLEDSVVDVLKDSENGTGFKFYEYKSEAFMEALHSALEMFQNALQWTKLQRRAMTQDFSWDRSAQEYLKLYERIHQEKI
ncbi:glycogen synthase GlgA [Desulforhabdus amnigena]|jgi:starch synthase|uniref:Glycogen synthase n=1 Tax=Desulforhabdus amnigena TaxID=40218 RepID=A0A9W6FUC3_9BACT|nr:glycogen synthase GlgA [Desulforhabdus amnigena]NLJ27512.1 glycogen synthase GlgA [Deltaproteobacteria bacterium]GLI35033.1 glycogen synthase 2 [Desulforhabdus amnigena]